MPVSKGVLAALKKLGADLPDDAASLDAAELLAKVRWGAGDLESKAITGKHWFEPRRVSFHVPRAYGGEPIPKSAPGDFLEIGSTDHQFLLLRVADAAVPDPSIIVLDPEDLNIDLGVPLSTLLANLRPKKSTPAALKKLVEAIEKGNLPLAQEAIREGADVNKEIRRDVMVPPLGLAMRNLHRDGVGAILVALLEARADPNHLTVMTEMLSGARSNDTFDAAAAALFAHGARITSKHSQLMPVIFASPKTLERMIDHGLDPNATAERTFVKPMIQISALCEVAWRGEYENAEVLIRRGADLNYVAEPYGLGPLHFAVTSKDAHRLVPLFVEHGARDRRSNALPAGLLRHDGKDVTIPSPGLFAREVAEQIGRPDVALLIPPAA